MKAILLLPGTHRYVIPNRVMYAALLLSLFAATVPLQSVAAQRGERTGNAYLWLQADSSTGASHGMVLVFPDGQPGNGAMMWACDRGSPDLASGIRLRDVGTKDTLHAAAWVFDTDPPQSVVLRRVGKSDIWMPDTAHAARFTHRGQTASRLVVTLAADTLGRVDEYRYRLRGLEAALGRLGCTGGGDMAGRDVLERASQVPWVGLRGVLTDAPAEVLPQIIDRLEFQRYLTRNYPVALRDAGVGGEVHVRFRVLQNGTVDPASVAVTRSTEHGFDEAAIEAARRLTFSPARIYGQPVRVWVAVPITYTIGAWQPLP